MNKTTGGRALQSCHYHKQQVFKVKNPALWLGSFGSRRISPELEQE